MHRPARQPPQQKRIDRAERQLPRFRARPGIRHVIQQPRNLGRGKIRIEPQARARRDQCFRRRQGTARGGRAPVLPDDRIVNRAPGRAIPDQRRLALIGNPHGCQIAGAQIALVTGGPSVRWAEP